MFKIRKLTALSIIAFLSLVLVKYADAFEIKQVTSNSGITAWLVEDHKNPLITMQFMVRSGSSIDPKTKTGLAYLVSGLLDEGAGDLDSKSFQATLEKNSIALSFNARMDSFSGTLSTLTETKEEAFLLLASAIKEPRFDPEPTLRVKSQIAASLRASKENPNNIAGKLWWQLAFPSHAYGRPKKGTPETLASITREDMKDYVNKNLIKDNISISVVGDITTGELSAVLDDIFGDLPSSSSRNELRNTRVKNSGETVIVERDIPQSVVIFGHDGIKRDDADWYAATILFEILAGGFGSRLTEEIREKRGLTYGVAAYPLPLDKAGVIVGSVSTVNGRVAESIRLIRDIWRRFGEEGPTIEEIQNAKDYINGSFSLRFTNSKTIVGVLNALQRFDLGKNYIEERPNLIEKVTPEDLKRVAKRIFKAESLTFVIVGNPVNIKATMSLPISD
ncbi:insulinase family protein [Rhodospirillaceae bacterium]|nr:insulinase family protein [Rhodospirillaceae bacterium]